MEFASGVKGLFVTGVSTSVAISLRQSIARTNVALRGALRKATWGCGKARLPTASVTSHLQLRLDTQVARRKDVQAVLGTLRTTVVENAKIVRKAAVTRLATSRASVDPYVHCVRTYVNEACARGAIFQRLVVHGVLVVARAVVGVLNRRGMQSNVSRCRIFETLALASIVSVVWIIAIRCPLLFRNGRNSSRKE